MINSPFKVPVMGVVGWKNSGKTGLVAQLIEKITQDGLRVAAIKHAHCSFDIDHPGTDSFRHRQAGACETVIASDLRIAHIREKSQPEIPRLADLCRDLAPCDICLVEGFKSEDHPKLEVRRTKAAQPPLAGKISNIVAVITDADNQLDDGERAFLRLDRNRIDKIVTFIYNYHHLTPNG